MGVTMNNTTVSTNRFRELNLDELKELEVILTHFILTYFQPNKVCIPCELVKEVQAELENRGIIIK